MVSLSHGMHFYKVYVQEESYQNLLSYGQTLLRKKLDFYLSLKTYKMNKIKHLLLMQEKVRKGSFLKLVEGDFQKRKGTCHTSDATTGTRQVTMLKTVLRN